MTLTLETMTLDEKLEVMELLWEDLSKQGSELQSPAWHGEVLRQRESRIAAGQARFIDWDEAKAALDRRLR